MRIMRYILLTVLAGAGVGLLWLYTWGPYRSVRMPDATERMAAPRLLTAAQTPVTNAAAWRAARPALIRAFERDVYGAVPDLGAPRVVAHRRIGVEAAGGIAGVEELTIELADARRFHVVIVAPPSRRPLPIIMMQNYCGTRAAFPGHPQAISAPLHFYPRMCRTPLFDPSHRFMFGRWINGPPFDLAATRGYALALFYGGDVVPDRAEDARAALASFGGDDTGAVAAWAALTMRIVDVLEDDARFDRRRIVAWGQSRYGKTALLAGALDTRIAAVIAFQSGRGGDALTRHRGGESVASMTRAFPHWFSPRFSRYEAAPPRVDQHQLLALIAPRPVLLGHARRDGWSDPAGAYMAAIAARPAFDLLGSTPPDFILRDGRHGVVRADWEATLDFLDARLGIDDQ